MTTVVQLGIFSFFPVFSIFAFLFFFKFSRCLRSLTLVARQCSFDFTKSSQRKKNKIEKAVKVSSGNAIIYGVIIFIELNSLKDRN